MPIFAHLAFQQNMKDTETAAMSNWQQFSALLCFRFTYLNSEDVDNLPSETSIRQYKVTAVLTTTAVIPCSSLHDVIHPTRVSYSAASPS